MKRFTFLASLAIVSALAVLCVLFIAHSRELQRDKIDRAVLNYAKYGLFSVAEWKKQATGALAAEINKLTLTPSGERELRGRIEVLLGTLIDDIYSRIREGNARSFEGRLKQSLLNMFVDLDEIKKGIPEYADTIMKELTAAKTQRRFKALLHRKLERYIDESFDVQDTSRIAEAVARTGSPDIESARETLDGKIAAGTALIRNEAILLAVLTVLLFSWSALAVKDPGPFQYVLLLLSLVILLAAGVTTPMIDMEAKISKMAFVLMGYRIHFENQVLYFQSKSILEVFRILIEHRDLQMKLVGALLVVFSVVFPLLKIALLPAYRYDYLRARGNRAVSFFVLRSGKWSMADVLVVAVFMAYVGFNGIINSQLRQLAAANKELNIMTTNGTALQPGYYLFLIYILLSLVFAKYLAGPAAKEEVT